MQGNSRSICAAFNFAQREKDSKSIHDPFIAQSWINTTYNVVLNDDEFYRLILHIITFLIYRSDSDIFMFEIEINSN